MEEGKGSIKEAIEECARVEENWVDPYPQKGVVA